MCDQQQREAGEEEPGDQPDANQVDPADPVPPSGPPPQWVLYTLAYMDWHENTKLLGVRATLHTRRHVFLLADGSE